MPTSISSTGSIRRASRPRQSKELRAAFSEILEHLPWTVVAAPNAGWASQVFGEPDVERLWAAVAIATRLDEPDPVAAWRAHLGRLAARSAALNGAGLDAIRYHGDGTDLTVGLLPGAAWLGGSARTKAGIEFLPNIPTEEVFTSPDWRRAEGVVRTTAPLPLSGTLVTGLRLRFEAGRIVDVDADEHGAVVQALLDADERARYLGEVALVDGESRVRRAGSSSTTPFTTRMSPATSRSGRASARSSTASTSWPPRSGLPAG